MISGSLAISRHPRDMRDAFRGTSEGIYLLLSPVPFLTSIFSFLLSRFYLLSSIDKNCLSILLL